MFANIEGSHLLRPIKTVKGSDQLRLLAKLREVGLMGDDKPKKTTKAATAKAKEAEIMDMPLEGLADLIDYVGEKFAHKPEEFEAFTMGEGGFERAIELVVSYAGLLGEGKSSGI